MRLLRSALLCLLASAPLVVAGPGRALSPDDREALVALIGAQEWEGLPPWRQRMLAGRYARFLDLPPAEQERIRAAGLKDHLVQPPRVEATELPPELRAEIEALPPELRPVAGQLATLRLQHLRLDRHLSLLPFADRRPLFRRLFPEPFEPEAAAQARAELEHRVARALAGRVRERLARAAEERGEPLSREEFRRAAKRAVGDLIRHEEERLLDRVRSEIRELRGSSPRSAREVLRGGGFPVLERLRLNLTPRQGELIRWAFDPRRCPLIDPGFLGEPPADPAERRLFEEDWRTLARLDLLSEADLPIELVLHLAGCASPEDFFRGVEELRGPESFRGPPPGTPGRDRR